MTVTINGEARDVRAETIADLLAALDLEGATVATALNGLFVARTKRPQTPLRAGDRVEILAPMQGG